MLTFPHFCTFPLSFLTFRAYFGIACSRLCAIINAFQWIRQGQGDILGLAHRLMSISSPFGCHIHLTSIPVYRTDFVRASCVFSGTLYLTIISISYKSVFVNRCFQTFCFFVAFHTNGYANVLRVSAKKYVKSSKNLLTSQCETTIIKPVLLSLWQ